MASLRIVGGDEGEQTIALGDGVVQIGRARDNDIVLTGAEKGVSRVHAEIRYENGRYVIVDLQSQNGTWVNGRRIERAEVTPGAEIALGEYRLTLQGDVHATRVVAAPRPAPRRDPVDDMRLREPGPTLTTAAPRAATPKGASRGMLAAAAVGVLVLAGVAAIWFRASDPARAASPLPVTQQPPPVVTSAPIEPPPADRPAPPEAPTAEPIAPEKRVTPASGGGARVARKPGESADAWRSRSAALQTRYGYSRAAMERGDFAAAAGGFEAILLEEPGFLDAAQLLVQSRAGLRANARTLHQAGTRLEATGDWVGALQKYEQARQIFSGIPGLSADVQRMRDKLRSAGTAAFQAGREHETAGRMADALREYEKAVQWLPGDDPNRQIARTRIEHLKKN